MQFVFGVGSKLFVWETSLSRVRVKGSGEVSDAKFEQAPVDPHGTLSSHLEISPQAVFEGASQRRFGFCGSEVGKESQRKEG